MAVEPEPEPFSVFRTQENDPVSKYDFTIANVVILFNKPVQLLSLSRFVFVAEVVFKFT